MKKINIDYLISTAQMCGIMCKLAIEYSDSSYSPPSPPMPMYRILATTNSSTNYIAFKELVIARIHSNYRTAGLNPPEVRFFQRKNHEDDNYGITIKLIPEYTRVSNVSRMTMSNKEIVAWLESVLDKPLPKTVRDQLTINIGEPVDKKILQEIKFELNKVIDKIPTGSNKTKRAWLDLQDKLTKAILS